MTESGRRGTAMALMLVMLLACTACGEHEASNARRPAAKLTDPNGITAAQMAEARRLLDPQHLRVGPTPAQVACVARIVVQNPNVDEIANDMAQIQDKDLRQLVMTDYLHCAYDFVLDFYMRFAPPGLDPAEKACIRSKFTQLTVARLSEVIVEDPDAGYTGPLVIQACQSGSATNPLLHGTLPGMGGGS